MHIVTLVHQYLDSDNKGTHADCVTVRDELRKDQCAHCIQQNNIGVLKTLVAFLKTKGNRQAILTETGGGNTASCET